MPDRVCSRLADPRVIMGKRVQHLTHEDRQGARTLRPQLLQDVAGEVEGEASVGGVVGGEQALLHERHELPEAALQEVRLVRLHDGAGELRVLDPQHLLGVAPLPRLGQLVLVEARGRGRLPQALRGLLREPPQLRAELPDLLAGQGPGARGAEAGAGARGLHLQRLQVLLRAHGLQGPAEVGAQELGHEAVPREPALGGARPGGGDELLPRLDRLALHVVAEAEAQGGQEAAGRLAHVLEVVAAEHLQEAREELHRALEVLDLRRLEPHGLAIGEEGYGHVLLGILRVRVEHLCGLHLQHCVDAGQEILKVRQELLLEGAANPLRSFMDVASLGIVCLKAPACRLHHGLHGLLGILLEDFPPDRKAQQGHALEGLSTECPLLRACRGQHHMLQHRHDLLVVGDKVRLYDPCNDSDRRDSLLLQDTGCGDHLLAKLCHEVVHIWQQELVLQVLGKVHKCRAGVRCYLDDGVVHQPGECGQHNLAVLLLQVRRVVRGGLADGVQRGVAHARVAVRQEREEQAHDLVHVGLELHGLRALRERHHGDVPVLPVPAAHEAPHALEDVVQHGRCAERPREAVDVLLAHVVVRDLDPPRVRGAGPVVLVLELEHKLHAQLDHLAHKAGKPGARLGPPLAQGDEELERGLPDAVVEPILRATDRQHHGHHRLQVMLEGAGGCV
mmetsp:Transcript_56656/g.165736  ORF Transcript_56656/g.165736 Transcript_56656/m.165736 type:complete len:676 (-) Transcript_56656:821-2848(-)